MKDLGTSTTYLLQFSFRLLPKLFIKCNLKVQLVGTLATCRFKVSLGKFFTKLQFRV